MSVLQEKIQDIRFMGLRVSGGNVPCINEQVYPAWRIKKAYEQKGKTCEAVRAGRQK
jgi:hypothetical protein